MRRAIVVGEPDDLVGIQLDPPRGRAQLAFIGVGAELCKQHVFFGPRRDFDPAHTMDFRRTLFVPFIGYVSEVLPNPPITRNQVELMEQDNVPEPSAPGLEALQISPRALENILSEYVTAGEGEAKA